MSLQKRAQKKIRIRSEKRAYRVRNRQTSRGITPRVCVFRSLSNIYAQIIDDSSHKTLISFSSLNLKDKSGDKVAIAKKVGGELAKIALEKSIKEAFFDRGKYLYHGRVKALAEGLREGGMQL